MDKMQQQQHRSEKQFLLTDASAMVGLEIVRNYSLLNQAPRLIVVSLLSGRAEMLLIIELKLPDRRSCFSTTAHPPITLAIVSQRIILNN